MKEHFMNEIGRLRNRLAEQGRQVELTIQHALDAFERRDEALAKQVAAEDSAIDREEIVIEEECLKVLALYQPVASDLRTIAAALKINTAMERMADFGVHIAERVPQMKQTPDLPENERIDFTAMKQAVLAMLRQSLDVVRTNDTIGAYANMEQDHAVDQCHRANTERCRRLLQHNGRAADYYVDCIGISRDLERIADLTTDICEHIIYLQTGRIVRHRR